MCGASRYEREAIINSVFNYLALSTQNFCEKFLRCNALQKPLASPVSPFKEGERKQSLLGGGAKHHCSAKRVLGAQYNSFSLSLECLLAYNCSKPINPLFSFVLIFFSLSY